MTKEKVEYILCGFSPLRNAELAFCSKCKKEIWPTKGTRRVAALEGIPLVCIKCLPEESKAHGFIHHGIFMPDATVEQVLDLLEHDLGKRRMY